MQSRRILVAEDEPIIAQHIRYILEKDGHWVMQLDDLQDIEHLLGQFSPDLVLLNFKQEGNTDGMAFARNLRQKAPVPILLVTGAPPKVVSASKSFHAGLPVLYKPFTQHQLSCFVRTFSTP